MRTHNIVMIRIPVRTVARARFFTSVSLGLSSERVVVMFVDSRESTLNVCCIELKITFREFCVAYHGKFYIE